MSVIEHLHSRAAELGVPLSVQLDLTWRCNECCVHCYLHDKSAGQAANELSVAEIDNILRQLAEAGTFFLTLSGGEPLLRPDFYDIVERARALKFNIKLKTNALLIGPEEARRLRRLNVEQVQVSIYSHRDAVHDTITRVPGSLRRSLEAIRLMREQGLKVSITDVLMKDNVGDAAGVNKLAEELGASFSIDPTITPMLNGDRSVLALSISDAQLVQVLRFEEEVGSERCVPAPVSGSESLDNCCCSAGHTSVCITPTGDVFPCIQFPVSCGNLREAPFAEIWRESQAVKQVRSVRMRDLPVCSKCGQVANCTRCPGLAYMEGDMLGKSSVDCRKAFAGCGTGAGDYSSIFRSTECFTFGYNRVSP